MNSKTFRLYRDMLGETPDLTVFSFIIFLTALTQSVSGLKNAHKCEKD